MARGTPKSWEQGIVDAHLADLRKTWGQGWEHLGEEIRGALLAQKVLSTIGRQDIEGYNVMQQAKVLDNVIRLAMLAIQAEV